MLSQLLLYIPLASAFQNVAFLVTIHLVALGFIHLLRRRLLTPHPSANPRKISTADLDSVSYDDMDMLMAIPRQATNEGYAVIGGSGYVGKYIVRLLLLRGECNIRILDITPPSDPPHSLSPAVSFIRTDITNIESVRVGLTTHFPSTGRPPRVIFHTAALIRFWERVSYPWHLSYNVNVRGTQNVMSVAANDLPGETLLVYTSTADVKIPTPHYMRLGMDYSRKPRDTVVASDDDDRYPENLEVQECNYTKSKAMAECAVFEANGRNGLRTGILRPGCTIMGPGDRLLMTTLTMPKVVIWGTQWSHTNVCVWDVAAAHLQYEDALRRSPKESSGQAFLITGKSQAWKVEDIRAAIKHFSPKPITFVKIDPLILFILCHVVEAFLFLRYYFLLPFYSLLSARRPNANPQWMGELVYMQPMTLSLSSLDAALDDSRARKIIGYRPQWETEQCIKYTVDEFRSGRSREHGLKLTSFG